MDETKPKRSLTATFILALVTITAVVLIITVISLIVRMPEYWFTLEDVARKTMTDETAIRQSTLVLFLLFLVMLLPVYVIQTFQVISGFRFALKGKWGIVCIVITALAIVANVYAAITTAARGGERFDLTVTCTNAGVETLMIVLCIRHYYVIRKAKKALQSA